MALKLSCHPDYHNDAISAITAGVAFTGRGKFTVQFDLFGAVDLLAMPAPAMPQRVDNLWQKSCFEAFIGQQGRSAYLELNFSPSTEWAVYAFENYRDGMSKPELIDAPRIETTISKDGIALVASFDLPERPKLEEADLEMALTAVIEEKNGRKSFWALDHPAGNPDFHDRNCFVHKIKAA